MPKLHMVDPYSADWWRMRRGIPTASQFHRIWTEGGRPSRQKDDYKYTLIAERLLEETMDPKKIRSPWVEHGHATEPIAVEALGKMRNLILKPIGFVTSNDGRIGSSPDCIVEGSRDAVEIKCPAPWTQIGYLLDGPGNDYRPQVQGHLLVGEWDKVIFFSYHPRMPSVLIETYRDEPYIRSLAAALNEFCQELDHDTERARRLGPYITAQMAEAARAEAIEAMAEELPGVAPWRQ